MRNSGELKSSIGIYASLTKTDIIKDKIRLKLKILKLDLIYHFEKLFNN